MLAEHGVNALEKQGGEGVRGAESMIRVIEQTTLNASFFVLLAFPAQT